MNFSGNQGKAWNEGIINSVIYALNSYGIQVEDRKPLERFIGPPLADSFMNYYGFDEAQAREAVSRYREYFSFLGGATMDGTRARKADVIKYVLETTGLTNNLDQITMVGDRKDDILGAKANGIRSIGVLYGFGSRKELEAAGAEKIAETVESIIEQAD